jgi:hypothetical protein
VELDARTAAASDVAQSRFFCFTSNVDAHSLHAFPPEEVYECHGNSEMWQCASPLCASALKKDSAGDEAVAKGRWRAPQGLRFHVDPQSRLAPTGPPAVAAAAPVGSKQAFDAVAFEGNRPRCVRCGGKARPSILMFEDCGWVGNSRARKLFQAWSNGILQLGDRAAKQGSRPPRLAILEIGAGANVTTVRRTSEGLLQDALAHGISPMLVRVNLEYPLADEDSCRKYTLPLLCTGLDAVRRMDTAITESVDGGLLSDEAVSEAWQPQPTGVQQRSKPRYNRPRMR